MRDTLAARLRQLANRLEPPAPRRPPAPLVRLGGRWWRRDELGDWAQIDGRE
jgi:hypothetical protein